MQLKEQVFEPSAIKNIIFDLGVVLLNVNYHLTEKAFVNLGLENFNAIYSKARQSGLFDLFEKGEITPEVFVETIRDQIPGRPEPALIIDAWNAMLLDFPEQHIRLLRQLKSTHDLYLLSNTNAIHYDAFNRIITEQHGLEFSSLFNRDYYSHRIGKRKPDSEVFDFIYEENKLGPQDTLFIDDSIQHVEGAHKAGYLAVHLSDGQTVSDVLLRTGILA